MRTLAPLLYVSGLMLLMSPLTVSAQTLATSTAPSVRIPIIVYHSVVPDYAGETDEQKEYAVTPTMFAEQLAYLRQNGYTPVSMNEVPQIIKEGTSTPRLFALTFDDGWETQYTYALPLLEHYHIIGTFFIYTNVINNGSLFLTWSQVRNLVSLGMTIGSHSITHPDFSILTDQDILTQIEVSKELIESEIQKPVYAFAVPYGYTSPYLESVLAASGYTSSRTLQKKATATSSDVYHLGGFIAPRDMKSFAWIVQDAP